MSGPTRFDPSRLLALRTDANLKKRALSRLAGFASETHVDALENGRLEDPKGGTLGAVADVLGCTVDYLLGRSDVAPSRDALLAAVAAAQAKAGTTVEEAG